MDEFIEIRRNNERYVEKNYVRGKSKAISFYAQWKVGVNYKLSSVMNLKGFRPFTIISHARCQHDFFTHTHAHTQTHTHTHTQIHTHVHTQTQTSGVHINVLLVYIKVLT